MKLNEVASGFYFANQEESSERYETLNYIPAKLQNKITQFRAKTSIRGGLYFANVELNCIRVGCYYRRDLPQILKYIKELQARQFFAKLRMKTGQYLMKAYIAAPGESTYMFHDHNVTLVFLYIPRLKR